MFSKLLAKAEEKSGIDLDGDGKIGSGSSSHGSNRDLKTPDYGMPFTPSGRKKALLIGINYTSHTQGRLSGCINDVHNVHEFLRKNGYKEENIRVLTDDNPNALPTRANITSGVQWLVSGNAAGDNLFFHYSGHGSQSVATGMSKLFDGEYNETICPVDYDKAGMIEDDELHKMLAKPVVEGARLTCIFDSCHSGSVLDLPLMYKSQDEYRNSDQSFFERHTINMSDVLSRGVAGIQQQAQGIITKELLFHGSKCVNRVAGKAMYGTKGQVIQFAGCRDDQTSADTQFDGKASGAMSYALIATISNASSECNYTTLIKGMRDVLHKGAQTFTQMPQMSFGRDFDPDQKVCF